MTRARRFFAATFFCTVLYVLAYTEAVSVPLLDKSVTAQLLPVLPWWLLVTFGSYSLGTLGWALFSFRDCPEAFTELSKEIAAAKDDLRRKGVSVD